MDGARNAANNEGMTRYVIDPLAAIELSRDYGVIAGEHQLVAPSSLRSQCLGILYRAVRSGDVERDEARRILDGITSMRIRLLGTGCRGPWHGESPNSWTGMTPPMPSTSPSPNCKPMPSLPWIPNWPAKWQVSSSWHPWRCFNPRTAPRIPRPRPPRPTPGPQSADPAPPPLRGPCLGSQTNSAHGAWRPTWPASCHWTSPPSRVRAWCQSF